MVTVGYIPSTRLSCSCLPYTSVHCDTAAITPFGLFSTSSYQVSPKFCCNDQEAFKYLPGKVSCSKCSLAWKVPPKGPVSPAFPNAPNWAFKRANCPVTHYIPIFWKAFGFKVLSTQTHPPKCQGNAEASVKTAHTEVMENLARDGQNMKQHGRIFCLKAGYRKAHIARMLL